MLDALLKMLSYGFLLRAAVAGLLVSLCAALLGVSLVLRRYSMIGDGLAHVGFGAMAVAAALNAAPLAVSVPVVVAAAFLLLRVSENSRIQGDAAVAVIATSALAVGVLVLSLTGGLSTAADYMFGSILAVSASDLKWSAALCAVVLILFFAFYHRIFAVTFDQSFAKATGVPAGLYNTLTALLTAVTIALGMRMMGTLLISSLIVFPALTSMRVSKKFRAVTVSAAVLSVLCFLSGIVLSYLFGTPAGASIVLVNILAFLLFSLAGAVKTARKKS